ncbi:HPr family phosphocarrier protein [Butyricicoccus sp.]|uniref:HPr family phosphocarrier protein n=1 Tax=Butyricicoccus sp. TaxID=2049021 RepID=UPI00373700BA
MKQFQYTITRDHGICCRSAAALAKISKEHGDCIEIKKDETSVSASRMMAVMWLNIRCGDTICISADGENEASAVHSIRSYCAANL